MEEKKIHIPRRKKEYVSGSPAVKLSQEAYNALVDI